MAEKVSVFYSWQSDCPAALNRSFIEKALTKAVQRIRSDAALDPALRDKAVEIDKDTKGICGSPPITETILRKIEDCAAFVADLTFVGASTAEILKGKSNKRLTPNPNVLIEYGYALSHHGHGHLVTVMNTAFGECTSDNLPFDLRHLRWPITYKLEEGCDDISRKSILDLLTKKLEQALKGILLQASESSEQLEISPLKYQNHTSDRSIYFDDTEELVPEDHFGESPGLILVPNEGRAYIRLMPSSVVIPLETELEAKNLANRAGLRPMGKNLTGWNITRNIWGAIAYEPKESNNLYHFTQLFLNGEIWGIDAFIVNLTTCRKFIENNASSGFIASGYLEDMFIETLGSYLKFYKIATGSTPKLTLEIGLIGIKGYALAERNHIHGKMLQNDIIWTGTVSSPEQPPHVILKPFFDFLWAKAGLTRPKSRDEQNQERWAHLGV